MKKRLLFACICLLWTGISRAQVTVKPRVEESVSNDVTILKVELTKDFTILHMRYETPIPSLKDRKKNSFPFETVEENIGIDPTSELQANSYGRLYSFAFVRTEGIPTRPNYRRVEPGDVVNFRVYYERLEPGVEVFDLRECRSGNRWTCWNFFNIHVKNPALKKKKNLNAPAVPAAPAVKPAAKPATDVPPLAVLFSGQVLDASTREPLHAKLAVRKEGAKADTVRTISGTGVFRKNLRSGKYQVNVAVPGYETAVATIDARDKDIDQDFLLKPLAKLAPPVVPPVAEPKPEPVETPKIEDLKPEVGNKIELKNILFETGKADLLPESRVDLDQVVTWLKSNPTVEIRLEGHTDAIGDPEKNMELSIERVVSVKRYLVGNGIAATRIQTKGFGDTVPLSTGRSQQERRLNRRVEMVVTKK